MLIRQLTACPACILQTCFTIRDEACGLNMLLTNFRLEMTRKLKSIRLKSMLKVFWGREENPRDIRVAE